MVLVNHILHTLAVDGPRRMELEGMVDFAARGNNACLKELD